MGRLPRGAERSARHGLLEDSRPKEKDPEAAAKARQEVLGVKVARLRAGHRSSRMIGGRSHGCKESRAVRGLPGGRLRGGEARGEEVTAMTDAQKRAQRNYVKKSVRQIALRFYPAEADLWEWLQAQDNKQGYLKGLVRADMAKNMERHGTP